MMELDFLLYTSADALKRALQEVTDKLKGQPGTYRLTFNLVVRDDGQTAMQVLANPVKEKKPGKRRK